MVERWKLGTVVVLVVAMLMLVGAWALFYIKPIKANAADLLLKGNELPEWDLNIDAYMLPTEYGAEGGSNCNAESDHYANWSLDITIISFKEEASADQAYHTRAGTVNGSLDWGVRYTNSALMTTMTLSFPDPTDQTKNITWEVSGFVARVANVLITVVFTKNVQSAKSAENFSPAAWMTDIAVRQVEKVHAFDQRPLVF